MPSAKPPDRPAFDSKTFTGRLYDRVLSATGKPYTIFRGVSASGDAINFLAWSRWIDRLKDTIKANAQYLDDVKADLDDHRAVDLNRHQALDARVTALEEAQSTVPFPGSG